MKKNLYGRNILPLPVLVLAAVLSCVQPMDGYIDRINDTMAPAIVLLTPQNNTDYLETVTVTGRATDSAGSQPGQVSSVQFKVTGTLGVLVTATPVTPDAEGNFTFVFNTIGFLGPVIVDVIAIDWYQNQTVSSLTLHQPSYSLPSFAAVPANKQVAISYAAVPGATGYTLYYTTDGTYPSAAYGTRIDLPGVNTADNPYLITGLVNGSLHVFQLVAHLAGADITSGYREAIPLSPLTLMPRVKAVFEAIRVEWDAIPGTDTYEVWRAEGYNASYSLYKANLHTVQFTDTGVSDNQWYFYKIKPSVPGGITSAAAGAEPALIPETVQQRRFGISLPGICNRSVISGNTLYTAAGSTGIHIINITKPDNPVLLATYPVTDADYLYGRGNYLYVLDSTGLLILDISTPANPQLAGSYALSLTSPSGIAVNGYYAFVVDNSTVIHILDIANPAAVVEKWVYTPVIGTSTGDNVQSLVISSQSNNIIFIATGAMDGGTPGRIQAIRVENPSSSTAPTLRAFYAYPNYTYAPSALTTNGAYVYALAFQTAILEEPIYRALLVSYNLAGNTFSSIAESASITGSTMDLVYANKMLYVADGRGIGIFDNTTLSALTKLPTYWDTPGNARAAVYNGRFMYVSSDTMGVQGIDLVSPAGLTGAATENTYFLRSLAVREKLLYGLTTTNRLVTYDITAPAVPLPTGTPLVLSYPEYVMLAGDYLFVCDAAAGLVTIDISTPTSPVLAATTVLPGAPHKMEIKGQYAYTLTGTGMVIVDISDPVHPLCRGFADKQYSMNDIVVENNLAYITDSAYFRPSTFFVYDISDPLVPVLTDKNNLGTMINGIAIRNGYAFLSDNFPGGGAGMVVTSIDPLNSQYLQEVSNPSWPEPGMDVLIQGNFLYLSDNGGIKLIDITNPANVTVSSILQSVTWASASPLQMLLSGKYLYAADSNNGLKIFSFL